MNIFSNKTADRAVDGMPCNTDMPVDADTPQMNNLENKKTVKLNKEDIIKKAIKIACYVVLLLSPAVCCSVAFRIMGGRIGQYFPSMSDMINYFSIVRSMLNGGLKGYSGYIGSQAPVGNFGTHGFFTLLPYYFFGLIFGWTYSSPIYANIMFLSLALLTVIILLKPTVSQSLGLAIFIVFNVLLMRSISDFMMETLNLSLGLIIVAVYMRFVSKTENLKIKILGGVVLIFAILSRVTNAIFVFPYMFFLLKNMKIKNAKKRLFLRILFSGIITFVAAVIGYVLFWIFGAPVPFDGAIVVYLGILKNQGLDGLIVTIYNNILVGAEQLRLIGSEYTFVFFATTFLPIVYLVLFVSSIFLRPLRAVAKEMIPAALLTVGLQLLYYIGLFIFYPPYDFLTTIRMCTVMTFVICCLTVLCCGKSFTFLLELWRNLKTEKQEVAADSDKSEDIKAPSKIPIIKKTLLKQFLSCFQTILLCILVVMMVFSHPTKDQISTQGFPLRLDPKRERADYVAGLRTKFNDIMDEPKSRNKWENTVAFYFPDNYDLCSEILAFPAGYAVNFYFVFGEYGKAMLEMKAKYVVFNPVHTSGLDKATFENNGFQLLLEEENVALYLNPLYINHA